MFCQKCNLHYHDHLSFCRRCGQPLARSTSDHAVDSHCCTRCGARVVRGENFCQQCGNRISVALQDTVIGACTHCGTSWRSGWLFCKNCGLDRKRALLLSTSTPAAAPSFPGPKLNGQEQHNDPPEIAKLNCHFCGAEAKPYSRFCESCGKRIDGGNAEKSTPQIIAVPPPPPPQAVPMADTRSSAPTIFELPSRPVQIEQAAQAENQSSVQVVAQIGEPALPGTAKNAAVNSANKVSPSASPDVTLPPPTATENPLSKPSAPVPRAKSEERHQGHAPTVITPLLPFTRMPDDLPVSEASTKGRGWNRQVFLQVALALGVIGLICFGLARWLGGSPFSDLETLTQPTPQVLEVKPSPQSSPVTQSSPPAASAEGMIYIPGGTFQMGRNDGDEYERPTHTVTIKPFLIDRTEVTNEAYQRFVAATGHRSPTHWPDGKFPESAAKLPVVNVSWDDANAYAQWAKKRLPTEAEWEFAARGNDGRIYPWGNTWTPSATNAARSTGGKLAEVGSFPNGASPFGVLDMCGNVWEWTSGSLKSYAQGEQEIAPGKVIRGGAFDVPSARATTTYRGVLREDRLPDKTGFRTVRDAATP